MHLILAQLALCCVVSGHVTTPAGTPLSAAVVTAVSSSGTTEQAVTGRDGSFSIHMERGRYTLRVTAPGYVTTEVAAFAVTANTAIEVEAEPFDSPSLRIIGNVRVNGTTVLSRAVVPNVLVTRAEMERAGNSRIAQALAVIPSLTFARPDGGSDAAASLIALRGPDPSETLVALDGQILNDGNTGDLDIARFPVAAFSNILVTEGLGPADTEGSNTIGGAVNIISLRPTRDPHSALSFSLGSFGSSEGWLNSTGTAGRLGYAFAFDDQQERGYVNQDNLLCVDPAPDDPCATTQAIHLGSAVSSRAALGAFTWTFSPNAAANLRIFSLGNTRDESASFNTPVDPAAQNAGDLFIGPGPATYAQTIRAYDLRGQAPLGAGSLVYEFSASNNDVGLNGSGPSPYDISHRDKRQTYALSWERNFANGSLAFGGYVRPESLTEDGVDGRQAQMIHSYFVRTTIEPSAKIRLQAGLFASRYSTFGTNLDGRFGASFDITPSSVIRASIGTGFRAPLLIERVVFPPDELPQDANCVALGQGNADLHPEHATEYELGYAHRFNDKTNIDVAAYRTNLRDPIENFYPLGASCPATEPPAQSFPINVGNVVYQGAEIRLTHRTDHLFIDARYGLNVAYPLHFPGSVSNPTSGGNLVANQQFLNIPQQQAGLGVAYDNLGWHAAVQTYLRGRNNELNQGPFAVLNAAVGKRSGPLDITLAGTNLTGAVAGKFTLPGMGTPYRGLVQQPDGSTAFGNLPTDALFLQPAGVRIIVTLRR